MPTQVNALSAMLEEFWPDEAAAVGSQYLGLIARAAVDDDLKPDMFLRSEGDHAFGIAEAISTLIGAASLIANCLQIRQAVRAEKKEIRAKLTAEIRKQIEDEQKVQRLADRLLSPDK